jgi:hypothetical protein
MDCASSTGVLIRHHLEHIDGSGFPDGIAGEAIPLASKILGVANAYDEIMIPRRFSEEKFPSNKIKMDFAFANLRKHAGKYYQYEIIKILEDVAKRKGIGKRSKRLRSVDELEPGMVIAVDLLTTDGQLIIGDGNTLSQIQIMKIQTLYKIKLLEKEIYVY